MFDDSKGKNNLELQPWVEINPNAPPTLIIRAMNDSVDDVREPSRIHCGQPMSSRQYARLLDEWVTGVRLRREDYGTHSMRRTKAAMIYQTTGNLRAVQILLGHSKIENTVRYLGVDV